MFKFRLRFIGWSSFTAFLRSLSLFVRIFFCGGELVGYCCWLMTSPFGEFCSEYMFCWPGRFADAFKRVANSFSWMNLKLFIFAGILESRGGWLKGLLANNWLNHWFWIVCALLYGNGCWFWECLMTPPLCVFSTFSMPVGDFFNLNLLSKSRRLAVAIGGKIDPTLLVSVVS